MPHRPFKSSPHTSNGKLDRSNLPIFPALTYIAAFDGGDKVLCVFEQSVSLTGVPNAGIYDGDNLMASCVGATLDASGTIATLDFGGVAVIGYNVRFAVNDPAIRSRFGAFPTPAATEILSAGGSAPTVVATNYDGNTQRTYVLFNQPITLSNNTCSAAAKAWGVNFDGGAQAEVSQVGCGPTGMFVQHTAVQCSEGTGSGIDLIELSTCVVAAYGGAPATDLNGVPYDQMTVPDDVQLLIVMVEDGVSASLGFNCPGADAIGGADTFHLVNAGATKQYYNTGDESSATDAVVTFDWADLAEGPTVDGPAQTVTLPAGAFECSDAVQQPEAGAYTNFPWLPL